MVDEAMTNRHPLDEYLETLESLTEQFKAALNNRDALEARIKSHEEKVSDLYRQLDYIRNVRSPG